MQSLRQILVTLFGVLLAMAAWSHATAFGFDEVSERATQLATAAYKAPDNRCPPHSRSSITIEFRDIRFKPARSLWRGEQLPFELAFFHEGLVLQAAGAHQRGLPGPACARSSSIRTCSTTAPTRSTPQRCAALGFAGFRVHYAINSPKYKDEVLVFLGASYFRALGKGQLLRLVGARTRRRHRPRIGRGVSALRRILDRAARAQRHRADDLRAARFAAHDAALIASSSSPASRRSSTSRRGCFCARTSPSSASRR